MANGYTNELHDAAEKYEDVEDEMAVNIANALTDRMEKVEGAAREEIRTGDHYATGTLSMYLDDGFPQDMEITVGTDWGDTIARSVHAPGEYRYLEYGTGARGSVDQSFGSMNTHDYPAPDPMPPYQDILEWVVEKPVIPDEYDSQYALARAIQRTIGRLGTHAHPFLRPAWFRHKPQIKQDVKKALWDPLERRAKY